jgi:hypothetical protein
MKCLKCDKTLKATKKDKSHNSKNGLVYDRAIYTCKNCDVWVTTEVPVKKIVKKIIKK